MRAPWMERTELLLGEEKLSKLQAAHVLIVGLGGVGAYAAEMIARAGVGELTLADADRVGESNINRQLIALHSTIGRSKVELVAERLRDLPPLTIFESEMTDEDIAPVDPMETTVRRETDTFFVEGKWLIDLMGRVNFDSYESLSYFQRALGKNGVIKLLEEKGCTDGHTVSIYGFEFDYVK